VQKTKRLTKEARSKQILGAAFDTFANNSYARATLDDIAEKAGISHALILKYFKTKKGLFLACLENQAKYMTRQLGEILSENQEIGAEKKLRKVFEFFFSTIEANPSYLRMMLRLPSEISDPDVKSLLSSHMSFAKEMAAQTIGKLVEDGTFRSDLNIEFASWLFVSNFFSTALLVEVGAISDLKNIPVIEFIKPFLSEKTVSK
jgi:AcrR family transcriptional regulator